MKKLLLFLVLIITVIFIGGYFFQSEINQWLFRPSQPSGEVGLAINEVEPLDVEIVAQNLQIPWEIVFLPSGEMLLTERPGRLLKIGTDRTVIPVAGVEHAGEGGLLGLALHPDFSANNYLYLYLTTRSEAGLINRVERYQLVANGLIDKTVIIDNIPGASFHDGGKIVFGPDRLLYITTGDSGKSDLAQDINSLAGKILRLKDDGSIPQDNPFGSAVYSYGHRNAQGLAWDDQGNLWATEHGRSGIKSGLDELNFIQQGKNYGWPIIQGDETQAEMVSPVIQSGPAVTWAPAGIAYWNGSLFFGGLRGEALYQAQISGQTVSLTTHFYQEFGRIRAVTLGPDGFLYISTSNTDGRGKIRGGDDKIIKINPKIFNLTESASLNGYLLDD